MSATKPTFDRLVAGTKYFRSHTFSANKATYERAATTPQKPDTLFITCADSRIDPELLTNSGPGQIFVARNVGNLIPSYGAFVGGVSAVIEYAVNALDVEQIIICGHEDCGAMKGLLNPVSTEKLPSVREWLKHAQAALSVTKAEPDFKKDEAKDLNSLVEQNVILQMNHLRTHPAVAGRLAQKKLDVYGWVYKISTGEIKMYSEDSREFRILNPLT